MTKEATDNSIEILAKPLEFPKLVEAGCSLKTFWFSVATLPSGAP
jgi:hypothetical protein